MNFRDLEYVIETARVLNFSRAAEICNVSQPSLSTQIKKLENELGALIFARTNRQINLTPFGQNFVKKAKHVLEIRSDMMDMAHQNNHTLQGKIRLGAILTVAPYLFPQLSATVKRNVPNVNLLFKEAKTEDLIKLLVTAKIDAAIISLPTDTNIFDYHHLVTEPFYAAMSKTHPLAKQKSLNMSDFDHQDMILLEEGHCLRNQALDFCQSSLIKENENFTASSLETIRYYIEKSNALTFMPDMACRSNDGLVYLPITNKKLSRDIGLIWLKSNHNKEKIDTLLRLMS
jgi:LysR family hydrogen peroxide-inducible transcriptional activator